MASRFPPPPFPFFSFHTSTDPPPLHRTNKRSRNFTLSVHGAFLLCPFLPLLIVSIGSFSSCLGFRDLVSERIILLLSYSKVTGFPSATASPATFPVALETDARSLFFFSPRDGDEVGEALFPLSPKKAPSHQSADGRSSSSFFSLPFGKNESFSLLLPCDKQRRPPGDRPPPPLSPLPREEGFFFFPFESPQNYL